MKRPEHRKHVLRSISKADDGSVELLGCSYRTCAYTETRRYGIGTFRRRPAVDPMAKKKGATR